MFGVYFGWRSVLVIISAMAWVGLLLLGYAYVWSLNGSVKAALWYAYELLIAQPLLPFLFLLAFSLRPLLFLPFSLFAVLSGVIFGFWAGLACAFVAIVLSALLTYGIARSWGAGARKLDPNRLSGWYAYLHEKPFETVLSLHLLFLPFDVVNYAAGALRIKPVQFVLGAIAGSIPSVVSYVSIGASVNVAALFASGPSFSMFDPFYLALAGTVAAISFLLAYGVRRWTPYYAAAGPITPVGDK